MDNFEEFRNQFSNMKLYQLERLVRKDYNKYDQQVYLIAVEELKKKTSAEYVRSIFNEMNNNKRVGFHLIYSIGMLVVSFLLLFFSIKFAGNSPSWGAVPNELIHSLQIIMVVNIITGIVAIITNKYFNFIVWPLLIINIFICYIGTLGFFAPIAILLFIPFIIAVIIAAILGGVKDYFYNKNNYTKNEPVNKIENGYIEQKSISDNKENIEMKEKCHKIFSLLIVLFYIAVLVGAVFTYIGLNIKNIGYIALEIIMIITVLLRCKEIYFEVAKNIYKKTNLNIIALVIFTFFSPVLFAKVKYLKLVVGALVIIAIVDSAYREDIRKYYESSDIK